MASLRNAELNAVIKNDALIIMIGLKPLKEALLGSDYFQELAEESGKPVKFSDFPVFVEAMAHHMMDEDDGGSTVVHHMLDEAAQAAVEDGAEGIRLPDDQE